MQYWVIFYGGVGGDGFVNLLEHADNVKPADGILRWRSKSGVAENGSQYVRFHTPKWVDGAMFPFRSAQVTEYSPPGNFYLSCIEKGINTVLPAHHDYWSLIDRCEYKDIFKKDRVMIHLYSENTKRVLDDFHNKTINLTFRLTEYDHRNTTRGELRRKEYDIHIDIERAWRDWDYLCQCLKSIGIDLDKKWYDEYLTFIPSLRYNT